MPIDADFLARVQVLRRPELGTELMGPLLYSLVRSTRPRRLLEVGMGYTTPFLLQALADNIADARRERAQMIAKSRAAMTQLRDLANLGAADRIAEDWFMAEPPLGAPDFHLEAHVPRLHAVDLLSHPAGQAAPVEGVLAAAGLRDLATVHHADFRGLAPELAGEGPFDFIWFDCGAADEYRDFLAEYWDLVSDRGGLLLLHLTLNDADLAGIVEDLKRRQAREPGTLEILSLAEPHKATQASCTMVRRIARFRNPILDVAAAVRGMRRLAG